MSESIAQHRLELLLTPEHEAGWECRDEMVAGMVRTDHPLAQRKRLKACGRDNVAGAAIHKHLQDTDNRLWRVNLGFQLLQRGSSRWVLYRY